MESRSVKVVVVGASKAGKSALLERFCNLRFAEQHETTVGVSHFTKNLAQDPGQNVELSLWDSAGRTEALPLPIDTYFRGAAAVLLVFDLTKSVREAWDWLVALRRHRDPLVFLVGTKADLMDGSAKEDEAARQEIVASGSQDTRKLPFFEVSARTGDGVSALMHAVVEAWTQRARRKVAFEAPAWGLAGRESLDIPVSSRHSATAEEVIAAFLDVFPQMRGLRPGGVIIRRRSTKDEQWDEPLAHTAVIDLQSQVSATFRLDVRRLFGKGICCEYYVARRDVVVPVQITRPGMVTMLVRFLNEDGETSERLDRFDPCLLPIYGHKDVRARNGFERPYGEAQKQNWTWERYLAEQSANAAGASCFTHGRDFIRDIERALALEEDARILEKLRSQKLLTQL